MNSGVEVAQIWRARKRLLQIVAACVVGAAIWWSTYDRVDGRNCEPGVYGWVEVGDLDPRWGSDLKGLAALVASHPLSRGKTNGVGLSTGLNPDGSTPYVAHWVVEFGQHDEESELVRLYSVIEDLELGDTVSIGRC